MAMYRRTDHGIQDLLDMHWSLVCSPCEQRRHKLQIKKSEDFQSLDTENKMNRNKFGVCRQTVYNSLVVEKVFNRGLVKRVLQKVHRLSVVLAGFGGKV